MKLLDVLFTAGGGGIFGSLFALASSWFKTKQEIQLMNAKVAAAEKEAAWKAFEASQNKEDKIQIVPGAAPWAATIAQLVDSFRAMTRPALTWALVGLILYSYISASPERRDSLSSELVFGGFTAVFWWFGSRYTKK